MIQYLLVPSAILPATFPFVKNTVTTEHVLQNTRCRYILLRPSFKSSPQQDCNSMQKRKTNFKAIN